MGKLPFHELKKQYLQKLYELSEGNPFREINLRELHSKMEGTNDQIIGVMTQFNDSGLVEYPFLSVMLTPNGVEEVERLMAIEYQELEYRILEKLVDNGKHSNDKELANYFSISEDYLYVFLNDFCKNEWIGLIVGGTVQLYDAGITAFHKWKSVNNYPPVGGNYYVTHNHGDSYNQIGGQANIQNVQISVNPQLDSAIRSLTEIVKNSSLSDLDKEDNLADIERIKQLAQKERTPDVVERAQKKISLLKSTLEIGELALKVTPLIEIIHKFF